MKEYYMKIAIEEAKKAYQNGDVPVGAVIVKNNVIVSKAYNKKEKSTSAIAHAEILAINEACKKLKTWHLNDCEIYITMEPCMMCMGAINESRINKIIYGVRNEKFGFLSNYLNDNYFNNKISKLDNIECINDINIENMLKSFFKSKRK